MWRKNLSELCGGFWCLRGLEPGVESEPLAIGLGCMGNPPPVTCALKEPLELGRGWGRGVLLDTVNLISLLKKKKRHREKQHVSAKTTLVLDDS